MKNKFFITIAFLFLVTVGFATYANMKQDRERQKEIKLVSTSVGIQKEEEKKAGIANPREIRNLMTEEELKELRTALPLKKEYKAEIQENPHQTPRSLITFAQKLGNLNEKALSNVTNADIFLNELDDCTANDDIAEAARALCLSKAEKLAKKFPVLNDRFKTLKDRTPASVNNTLQKQRSLLR